MAAFDAMTRKKLGPMAAIVCYTGAASQPTQNSNEQHRTPPETRTRAAPETEGPSMLEMPRGIRERMGGGARLPQMQIVKPLAGNRSRVFAVRRLAMTR